MAIRHAIIYPCSPETNEMLVVFRRTSGALHNVLLADASLANRLANMTEATRAAVEADAYAAAEPRLPPDV